MYGGFGPLLILWSLKDGIAYGHGSVLPTDTAYDICLKLCQLYQMTWALFYFALFFIWNNICVENKRHGRNVWTVCISMKPLVPLLTMVLFYFWVVNQLKTSVKLISQLIHQIKLQLITYINIFGEKSPKWRSFKDIVTVAEESIELT